MKYIRDLYRRYITCGHRLFGQQHDNDQYYRNYWQRPAFSTRNGRNGSMAKCIGAQSLLPGVWGEQQQLHDASAIATTNDYHQPSSPAIATSATNFNTPIHYDDAQYWHIRHADNSIQPVWSSGESFDDDEPSFRSVSASRRRSINAHDHLPVVRKSINEMDPKMATVVPLERASSNQASVRGSFRSEGSGQSQVCRPFSQLSYSGSVHNRNALLNEEFLLKSNNIHHHNHHHNYHHYHSCFSPHFHNCQDAQCYPVYVQEALNRKAFLTQLPHEYLEPDKAPLIDSNRLNELPVLKTIHGQSINGINRNRFQRTNLDGSLTTLRATIPISRSAIHFANRPILSKRPKLEPVPEAIYDSTNIRQGEHFIFNFYHSD